MGDKEEAEFAGSKALALTPGSMEVRFNLASLYQDQRRLPMAIAAYWKLLQHNPRHVQALGNLGSALESVGDLDDALARLDGAISVQPDRHKAHHNRAVDFTPWDGSKR